MKLRIKNDSIRLRLSQKEIDRFAADGRVEDVIRFGPDPKERLSYSVTRNLEASSVSAELSNNQIDISLPAADADEWTSTKKVGFEIEQSVGDGEVLTVIVEKDFQRLKPRSADDVDDKFPHPRSETDK